MQPSFHPHPQPDQSGTTKGLKGVASHTYSAMWVASSSASNSMLTLYSFSSSIGWIIILELGKLGLHCRVAPSQLLDRHVLRFVVRKTKVPIGAEQGILCFLQVVDRLVDLVDRHLEALGGEVVVLPECGLECLEIGFKVRDVDVLRPNERKLRLVLERVHRRIPQQRDDWKKELRTDDVHLREPVEHVDDPGVVKLTVGL